MKKGTVNLTVASLLAAGFAIYASSTLVAMAVMSIGAGLLGLSALYALKSDRRMLGAASGVFQVREVRIFLWASIFLTLAVLVSLLSAVLFPYSIEGFISQGGRLQPLKELPKLWYFAWPFLMLPFWVSMKGAERDKVLRAWVTVAAILAVVGIIQFFTGWPRRQSIPAFDGFYHATLWIGHHLSVASIFIFPFFATLGWSFPRGQKTPLSMWKARLFATLLALVLMLTFSRTLWAALPFGVVLFFVLRLPWKAGLALVCVGGILAFAALQVPSVQRRVYSGEGRSERFDLWDANWHLFQDRPLTGVGFRQNSELSGFYLQKKYKQAVVFSGHAHNNLLEALSGTGFLGGAAWLFFCGAIIWITWKGAPSALRESLLSAWVVFHLNGLTQVNFWEGKVMHQMMWVILICLGGVVLREREIKNPKGHHV